MISIIKKEVEKEKTLLTKIFTKDIIVTNSGTDSKEAEKLSSIPQENKLNSYNDTVYSKSPNAVKLLPVLSNNNGKIKLYTEINSNLKVGDVVYIMYDEYNDETHDDIIIIDSYLEFTGCTNNIYLKQMQGYKIIEIGGNNNEITIDRYFDSRFDGKKIYNHYISRIYVRNIIFSGGEIDGASILKGIFNDESESLIDINLVQSVILSGNSYYMKYKDKYDKLYMTTNSELNTGYTETEYKPYIYKGVESTMDQSPSVSFYTNNNNYFGYNYIYNNDLNNCRIENGYYNNCTINNCIINGGVFINCQISSTIINDGSFYDSPLSNDCYWFYGTWSGGTFNLDTWYNGVWNNGNFIGKDWRNGVFNDGYFSGSTWRNGLFQGGVFTNSTWVNGVFSGGDIINSNWNDGIFNGGNMYQCEWDTGSCNGGLLFNVNWVDGIFNNGTFENGVWDNGTFNDGNFLTSRWNNGIFNNGKFKSQNNVPLISSYVFDEDAVSNKDKYWYNGVFNGGVFTNSIWVNGIFKNGDFIERSLWSGGTFLSGNFKESSWINGIFENGVATESYFHNVEWIYGIWNGGTLGVPLKDITPTVIWRDGIFNRGTFGYKGSISPPYNNVEWHKGSFYNGYFYTYYENCASGPWYGGFSGGTFYDGYFDGVFWRGTWVNGVISLTSCNKTNMTMDRNRTKINPKKKIISKRRYGELPIGYGNTEITT